MLRAVRSTLPRAIRGAPGSRDRAWPWPSVRLGPEVDEPHRLDALRAHFVELADPLWLEVAVELRPAREPRGNKFLGQCLVLANATHLRPPGSPSGHLAQDRRGEECPCPSAWPASCRWTSC